MSYVRKKYEELIEVSKKAVDILMAEIEQELDPELSDEKRRNAIKAKKECFDDCQELIKGIDELQTRIDNSEPSKLTEEKKDFNASFAEKHAK